MAGGTKKKGATQKKSPKDKKKGVKKEESSSFGRVALAVGLVFFVVLFGGLPLVKYLPSAEVPRRHAPAQKKATSSPPYEVFEQTPPSPPSRMPVAKRLPRLAVIIDDVGYKKGVMASLMALDPEIAFAVLPKSPYGKSFVRKA